jgi:hypothetical protein
MGDVPGAQDEGPRPGRELLFAEFEAGVQSRPIGPMALPSPGMTTYGSRFIRSFVASAGIVRATGRTCEELRDL